MKSLDADSTDILDPGRAGRLSVSGMMRKLVQANMDNLDFVHVTHAIDDVAKTALGHLRMIRDGKEGIPSYVIKGELSYGMSVMDSNVYKLETKNLLLLINDDDEKNSDYRY